MEDVFEVVFDGVFTNEECVGDYLVAEPFFYVLGDFQFSLAESEGTAFVFSLG